jgi:hypothetical protein
MFCLACLASGLNSHFFIRKDFEKNIVSCSQYSHRTHTYPVLLVVRAPETDVDFSHVLSGMSRKWLECALFIRKDFENILIS